MSLDDLESKGLSVLEQFHAPSAIFGVIAGGLATSLATWLLVVRPMRKENVHLKQKLGWAKTLAALGPGEAPSYDLQSGHPSTLQTGAPSSMSWDSDDWTIVSTPSGRIDHFRRPGPQPSPSGQILRSR